MDTIKEFLENNDNIVIPITYDLMKHYTKIFPLVNLYPNKKITVMGNNKENIDIITKFAQHVSSMREDFRRYLPEYIDNTRTEKSLLIVTEDLIELDYFNYVIVDYAVHNYLFVDTLLL